MSERRMEFGVLLPHFSDYCTWERLIGFAPRIEALGFDSVWVRDNLSYYGHGFELPGNRFIDPFVTLSTIAGCTQQLKLGAAVAIPFRHPLVTAQLFGSLSWVSRGRVEGGLGPGTPSEPFTLTGIPYKDRIRLCKETAEVLRLVAQGPHVSYHGKITSFDDATIDPPPPADMPIWYGGASNASVRRILDYCDGMLPGRSPFSRYDVALKQLREGAAERGRTVRWGSIPLVTIGRSREEAVARANLGPLLAYLSDFWKTPYESVEDVTGALIAGTPEQCIAQVQEFVDRDLHVLVFDARMQMPEFEEVVEQLGQEVMPAFRRPEAAAR